MGIPSLALARLQRWALLLSACSYDVSYKSTQIHSNADGLSGFPLPSDQSSPNDGITIFNMGQIQALPVTFRDIQEATKRNSTLSRVMEYIKMGWKTGVLEEIKPYVHRRGELRIENGCFLWGA